MLLSTLLSLISSFLSVAAAQLQGRDPIHIPVLRRRHVRHRDQADLHHYAKLAAGLRDKYNYGPSVSRRAQTTDFILTDQVRRVTDVARPRLDHTCNQLRVRI
jgi:hypothetical protein